MLYLLLILYGFFTIVCFYGFISLLEFYFIIGITLSFVLVYNIFLKK